MITTSCPLIIAGDFNFYRDDECDRAAARFQVLLEVFNLVQYVQGSTRKSGHTLDLVITRQGEEPVKNVRVTDPVVSDHSLVHWEISCFKKPGFERKEMKYLKLRSVNRDCFLQQIRDSALLSHDTFGNVSELALCYDTTLSSLLDRSSRSFCNKNCYFKARCSLVL